MKIGILGGGQLGRMLALRGAELGYEFHILSTHEDDPAAQVTRHWRPWVDGDDDNFRQFFAGVDVVTFESEFIDVSRLVDYSRETGTPLVPNAAAIDCLRDRATQKAELVKGRVPTAEFIEPKDVNDLLTFLRAHRHGIVCKKRLFGYDGYGTFVLTSPQAVEQFAEDHHGQLTDFIAEQRMRFRRELAVTLVRGPHNQVTLPLVEWKARDNKCHWVKGPVKHRAFAALERRLKRFVSDLEYRGAIAFELFDVNGELFVNEVAPRVHNSAHYTLNALHHDQFQLHLMAVAGEKLPPARLIAPAFAMVNLIGSSTSSPQLARDIASTLHWYNKRENRPGRKMGHLNATARTADEALRTALRDERRFKL